MGFTRRRFLEGVVESIAGIGLAKFAETDAGRKVTGYLFGDDPVGFKPIEDDDQFERVFGAYGEIDERLRNGVAIDDLPEINGDGSMYVLGQVNGPLGVAYVDAFENPDQFLRVGYLGKDLASYRSFRDRIFSGWKGGDVIEVVPTSFYGQGLDGVAGDLEVADLSRPSARVLGAMVNQAKDLGAEYTFVRVPIGDAFRIHAANPSSAGAMGGDSMLLVYDQNDDGISYDAVSF